MILDRLQAVLDALLAPAGVPVYWQRARGGGPSPREYVVYRQSGGPPGLWADNRPLTRQAAVTVCYYYQASLLETEAGRRRVQQRAAAIEGCLEEAGFVSQTGLMWLGELEESGLEQAALELIYEEVAP